MKIKSILIAAFVALGFSATAQTTVGVRGGYAGSFLSGLSALQTVAPNSGFNHGYSASVFMELPVTSHFTFQPEISTTEKGVGVRLGLSNIGKVVEEVTGQTIPNVADALGVAGLNIPISANLRLKNTYIEFSPLAKFYSSADVNDARYYFIIGPSVGILADSRVRTRLLGILPITTPVPTSFFKTADFSGIAGIGFELPVADKLKMMVEGRYQHGFTRAIDLGVFQFPIRNRTMMGQFGVKYTL